MIEFRSIYKAFSAPILRGLNLRVAQGDMLGLIGPPASGKTLLMKILTGLVAPDAGRVRIEGATVDPNDARSLADIRRSIGMQFQNNALFDFMSVAQNVSFPLRRLAHLPEEVIAARVSEGLRRVALAGFEERRIPGLSGGQRRRVGIARAMVGQPELLIYDEPAAGLDPVTSQKIFDLLRAQQQRQKKTAIIISSDLDRLLPSVDHVGMLYRGRLIFEGTPEEAYASEDPRVHQFVHGEVDGPL